MPKRSVKKHSSPVPILLAGGFFGVAILVTGIVIIGIIGYLVISGYFQSQVQLTATSDNRSICGEQFTYSVQMIGTDGRGVSAQQISTYINNVFLENLTTDQNGRYSSTIRIPLDTCGKRLNLSVNYHGDLFHKNASANSIVSIQVPTKIQIFTPSQAENSTGVLINVTLYDAVRNIPIGGKTVIISNSASFETVTNNQGFSEANIIFNETGIQSIKSKFNGDEYYLPSESEIKSISVVPRSCGDGTIVGHCSSTQISYYCNDQKQFTFNCSKCGCSQGLVCSNGACITQEQKTAEQISQLQNSVVLIQNSYALGSGVVIKHQNGQTIILTNRHVIADAVSVSDVSVKTFNQKTVTSSDVRVAPYDVDLAIVYVPGTYGEVAQINYSELFLQGENVIAIGSPGGANAPTGLQGSVSTGVISNFVSENTDTGYSVPFIQITAPITHGNSGGGLFLANDGNLIGINSQILLSSADLSQTGFGFAIDIKELQNLPPYDSWAEFSPILRCSDGTSYNSCSISVAGDYCSDGNLIPSCQTCGCSTSYPYCNSFNGICFSCNSGGIGHVDNNGQSYCCANGYSNYVDDNGNGYCCPNGYGAWIDNDGGGFCCPPGKSGYAGKLCG